MRGNKTLLHFEGRPPPSRKTATATGSFLAGPRVSMASHSIQNCDATTVAYPLLLREHFTKHSERPGKLRRLQATKSANQATSVHRAELIQHDVARPILEPAGSAECVFEAPDRYRRHQGRIRVTIQLVRRHNGAGTLILDFLANRGLQINEEDLSAPRGGHSHVHPVSPNAVGVGSSSRPSSLRSLISFAASRQPTRGTEARSIGIPNSTMREFTVSSMPASSMSGFGMRPPENCRSSRSSTSCQIERRSMDSLIAV